MSDAELLNSISSYGRRRPFRPYFIEFMSGAQVQVNHPDGVAQFRTLFLFRGRNRTRSVFPSASVCRLLDLPTSDIS